MHYTLCDLFSDLTQNAVEAGADHIAVALEENRPVHYPDNQV